MVKVTNRTRFLFGFDFFNKLGAVQKRTTDGVAVELSEVYTNRGARARTFDH
jgi:hypothetical protein